MSFHLSHIHDYDRFIALDVGFYRVRAGMYEVSHGEIEQKSVSSVRQLRKNIDHAHIVDMRGVADIIERSLIQCSQKYQTIAQDIIVGFSSGQFLFDSITIQYHRENRESPIDMSEIDSMIKKIEGESFARAKAKGKREFGIDDDIRLVSSTITSIAIDGKSCQNPLGFSGSKMKLTILNVFVPASEFNIIRSIVASLDKRIISLIPSPLIFSKLIEYSDYIHESLCVIDVGYMSTTLLIQKKNEILAFETFSFGSSMLLDMLARSFPELSPIQRENMLFSEDLEKIHDDLHGFLEYVKDVCHSFLHNHESYIRPDFLFCHGGIFENTSLFRTFDAQFHDKIYEGMVLKRIEELLPENIPSDSAIVHGLSYMASELLHVKKDPLIRLLRYVLYNYE